jgi:sterol desaturase/sphingolipid hydroxylase (fatty acid hydroxylase superfamily)
MEAYAAALTYAIPFFVLLILVEAIAAYWMKQAVNVGADTIASLSSGMTNTMKDILGLSIAILSYEWMVEHWGIWDIQATVWVYIIAFIWLDFAAYWSHRFNHTVNLFWNRHIVHHSSEEFNLSCALRQSISSIVSIYFFLYIPIAIIGVPAVVIAILAPLHLFAQFWYHTRLINKMGWLEHLIVTPSHHRVHHAINPEYIDKNYAAIFIVWDKWFGTFQEELPDHPPVYGTLKPVSTWNPLWINFMHAWGLVKDAWRTRSWWDKVRIWFMPTGWRPADVAAQYPTQNVVTNVYDRPKYRPEISTFLLIWSWIQLGVTISFIYYALLNFGEFSYLSILLYMVAIFLSILAYTSLMDQHWIALPLEITKVVLAVFVLIQLDAWSSWGGQFVLLYLGSSFLITVYFSLIERTQKVKWKKEIA